MKLINNKNSTYMFRKVKSIVPVVIGFTTFAAEAGHTFDLGEEKSLSLGFALRSSYTHDDNNPSGNSSDDFNLDSTRLFIDASITKVLKGTLNFEKTNEDDLQVMDAIARFEFSDGFNVWAGRLLAPSDRAYLDGPYFLSVWEYPFVSQYPAKFSGRDDGLVAWGKLANNKLTYAIGAFRGHNRFPGASNEDESDFQYAARLQYNFLDAEPNPAYYTSSTYYGKVEVFTLGFSGRYQNDGVGTSSNSGDYTAFSFDMLYEHKFSWDGVIDIESAYYDYDTDNVIDVQPGFGGANDTDNVGGVNQGTGWLAGIAYLIPGKVGIGALQPYFRYQEFEAELSDTTIEQADFGLNYVISGHNARISATYSNTDQTNMDDNNRFILGVQFAF